VMGEATGTVYNGSKGQGRILVCFYRGDSTMVARTLTESDGYYSYLGLKPGKYIARIDPEQLKKLKMVSSPAMIPVNIASSRDGSIIDGLDFRLSLINKEPSPDTAKVATPVKLPPPAPTPPPAKATQVVKPGTAEKVQEVKAPEAKAPEANVKAPDTVEHKTQPLAISSPTEKAGSQGKEDTKPKTAGENKPAEPFKVKPTADNNKLKVEPLKSEKTDVHEKPVERKILGTVIQVGAFSREKNALKAKGDLLRFIDHPIYIIFEKGLYKVQIDGFQNRKQALEVLPSVVKNGFPQAFIPQK
jgi:hypothetical protein